MNAVKVSGLSFAYGDRTALTDVGFSVGTGERFALLGPNGGGKTTLFRILSTLIPVGKGVARICDLDVGGNPSAVRRKIGVVFQSPSLDGKLRVRENLMHHGHLYGMRGAALAKKIDEVMERFGVADRSRDRAETLSGGLKRRVEIAKGILTDPEVILMDEPSTGLDPGARRDLWGYLEKEEVTILFTTHLMEEAERCDRIAILDRGCTVALGKPDELRSEIGGDVISVEADNAKELSKGIRETFGLEPSVLNGTVRIEREGGHAFVARLAEAFPGRIRSIRVGKPTLEDVFIRRTGHRMGDA